MSAQSYRLGIVGATGAVGQELIRLLHERRFPLRELVLLASARSAGLHLSWKGQTWTVREATPESFDGLDCAIFSAGGGTSEKLAPEAVKRGCLVIDNSSFFRMDPAVPLVLPEINAHALAAQRGIIANPNCSTAVALMGLYPLHRAFGLKGFFAATYQAVSGTGAQAIRELETQTRAWAEGRTAAPAVYPHPIAFNVFPHVDKFLESGYTKEEMKMLNESRKILELPKLRVTCTCVRVPVFRAHSVAISAEFERPVDLEKARAAIGEFSGAELCDDPAHNRYPMPLDYAGRERCGVGRLRRDTFFENGLSLWVTGDQLWKGAALNAVQIAEVLHAQGKLGVGK
jgi:aspartate-semialdehyde dehydrogenase